MSTTARTSFITPEEYLVLERAAGTKSEYFRGEMFALAGAGRRHNLLVASLIERLRPSARRRGCQVYPSDLRIGIRAIGKYTYPDVSITCGKEEFEDAVADTLLNPVVLVEVLSETTERYDRGAKFEHYQKLPSLRLYVLVAQDRPRVEVFARAEAGFWRYEAFEGAEAILPLDPPGAAFSLGELYEGVLEEPAGD